MSSGTEKTEKVERRGSLVVKADKRRNGLSGKDGMTSDKENLTSDKENSASYIIPQRRMS